MNVFGLVVFDFVDSFVGFVVVGFCIFDDAVDSFVDVADVCFI